MSTRGSEEAQKLADEAPDSELRVIPSNISLSYQRSSANVLPRGVGADDNINLNECETKNSTERQYTAPLKLSEALPAAVADVFNEILP